MGGAVVGAYADDFGAGVGEGLVAVAEGAGFLRAAGRVVLRVEVEDDVPLAAEIRQADALAGGVRQVELRGGVAHLDARFTGPEQAVEQSHASPSSDRDD